MSLLPANRLGNVAVSKAEKELEKHLLNTTIKLSDGTKVKVFSRGDRNEMQLFLYSCLICGVSNLPGERVLHTHIQGRKHQAKLQLPYLDADSYKANLNTKKTIQIKIAPGEPIPPGFEGEIKALADIQATLDACKDEPLIGLEYLVELTDSGGPTYHCVICNLRFDAKSIMGHLKHQRHRLKYLEKHFPATMKVLNPYRFDKERNHIIPEALKYVCKFTEQNVGRLSPVVFAVEEFNRKKMKIFHDINNDNHVDEDSHTKFKTILTVGYLDSLLKEITKSAAQTRNRSKSPAKSITDDLDDISSSESMDETPVKRSRTRSISPNRKKLASKKSYNNGRSRKLSESDAVDPAIWEKFRKTVEIAVNQMNKEFKEYEKNPEKHPLYAKEWKDFWCRRFKEMKSDGKDPTNHDFRPEWIKFWTIRMKELHDEDIDKKKQEIRKGLGLPSEDGEKKTPVILNDSPVQILSSDSEDEKKSRHSNRSKSKRRSRSRRHTKSRSRSRSSGSDYGRHHGRKRRHSRERERRESERSYRRPDYREYKKYMETSYDKMSYDEWYTRQSYRPAPPMVPPGYTYDQSEMDDGPVTFVTVCRLLTALEDDLGEKLGNRVTDLLAKSLSLEKVKANSADEILLTKENCDFFEIIKERLKGRLIANIVPPHKLQAVRRAIRNIATLVHQAGELEDEKPKVEEPVTAGKPDSTTADVVKIDRTALAIEITKALVAQGKTDTTKGELEELINVYVKMKQQKSETENGEKEKAIVGEKEKENEKKEKENDGEKLKEKEKLVEKGRESSEEKERIIIPRRKSSTDSDSPIMIVDKSPILAAPSAAPEETLFGIRKNSENDMNSLNDDDLKTLLQNFTDLSSEEQKYLISYLKDIETRDPERVEQLKKYVNIGSSESPKKKKKDSPKPSTSRSYYSPTRRADSDSDDYDLDFSAGTQKKKGGRNSNFLLSDKSSMVSNLMSSLQNSVQQHTIPSLSSNMGQQVPNQSNYYDQWGPPGTGHVEMGDLNQQYDQMMQQINFEQQQQQQQQQQGYMNMNMYPPNNYGNPYYDMNAPGTNPMNPYPY